MNKQSGDSEKKTPLDLFNTTLAVVIGQVGCITFGVLIGAVFLGRWLDAQFNSKPTLTLVSILVSIPVSIILMLVIVRAAVGKFKVKNNPMKPDTKEGPGFGEGKRL